MTEEEYQKKIDEIKNQKYALDTKLQQLHKVFKDSLLGELEEQGITPGTKVLVKTKSWLGKEIEIETYFFDAAIEWDKVTRIFHKVKNDGTMSKIRHYIEGAFISIHKI